MGATGLILAASDVRGVNGSTTAIDGRLVAGGSSNIEKSRVTLPAPSLACSTTSMNGSLMGASLLNTNTFCPLGI